MFESDGKHEGWILGDAKCCPETGILDRNWVCEAIHKIEADFNRSADTHLLPLSLAGLDGVDIYLKDESTHPTGSLKHRLARSLFLFGLCNGKIGPETTIVEASSGSTAISEAYFARLLDLPFVAVIADGTSPCKVAEIERYGGRCEFATPRDIYAKAELIALETAGYYMDQFTFAERATDWRGNNNIAESLFEQMRLEPHSAPNWIVVGAGTGGTSATIGRFTRYRPDEYGKTKLCVADPEGSVFFDGFANQGEHPAHCKASRIEGVGRPRLEPSFVPSVIDRMVRVKDAASVGTAWWLEEKLGRRVGGSTGLNVFVALKLACEMQASQTEGSIVTMICDGGGRYQRTIYNADWLAKQKIDPGPVIAALKSRFDAA